jgi:hypothetical protein
MLAFS